MRDEHFHDGVLTLHCIRCDRWLPPDAFPVNPRMRRGRNSWCKECQAARTRQWRAENAEAINAPRRVPVRACVRCGGPSDRAGKARYHRLCRTCRGETRTSPQSAGERSR